MFVGVIFLGGHSQLGKLLRSMRHQTIDMYKCKLLGESLLSGLESFIANFVINFSI